MDRSGEIKSPPIKWSEVEIASLFVCSLDDTGLNWQATGLQGAVTRLFQECRHECGTPGELQAVITRLRSMLDAVAEEATVARTWLAHQSTLA